MDSAGYIYKTLKHFKDRFVWLALGREFSRAVPYGYGYIVEIFEDAIVFDSIDAKGKKFCRSTIAISEIKGVTWDGENYRKARTLANFTNFEAKKDIMEEKQHVSDETRSTLDAKPQQQS